MGVLTLSDNHGLDLTDGVVVIDFWRDDCAPCAKMAPTIDALAKEFPTVRFFKANVKDAPALATFYGVYSFPTLFILNRGKRETWFVGWMPYSAIAEMIQDVLRT